MSQADKYEDERFNSVCPTCGQTFLRERVDQLTAVLRDAVACYDQGDTIRTAQLEEMRAVLASTGAK